MPLFSIVVPVYKVEAYLPTCVESILRQSFTDFELILIDDGSPDRCGTMCDSYAERDERVRVIHKENGGVSSARNRGIEAASGSWIWFVDSDDYIEPYALERLYTAILEEPALLYVFNCRGVRESFSGGLEAFLHRYYFTYVLGFGPWNKLYSAELISRARLRFDEQETIGEDLLFNVRYYAALFGSKIESVFFLGRDYYHYVDRAGSAMNTKSKTRLQQQLRLFDKLESLLNGSVSNETVTYLFLLHLISGIVQSASGGMTAEEFAKEFNYWRYKNRLNDSVRVLDEFYQNENATLSGRLRVNWFLFLLNAKNKVAAGKLMGLY